MSSRIRRTLISVITAGALALTGTVAGSGAIALAANSSTASTDGGSAAVGAADDEAATTGSGESTGRNGYRGCERSFDAAQRRDMESFRDYDAATWRAVHDPDAVSIFASGARIAGIDKIIAALAGHFADREATFSWKEINRRVDGCRTAVIEYETVYEIKRVGFYQRALTAVTYTFSHGRWLVILDQGTLLPRPAGS